MKSFNYWVTCTIKQCYSLLYYQIHFNLQYIFQRKQQLRIAQIAHPLEIKYRCCCSMIIFPRIHKFCERKISKPSNLLKIRSMHFQLLLFHYLTIKRKSKDFPGKDPRSREKRINMPTSVRNPCGMLCKVQKPPG